MKTDIMSQVVTKSVYCSCGTSAVITGKRAEVRFILRKFYDLHCGYGHYEVTEAECKAAREKLHYETGR